MHSLYHFHITLTLQGPVLTKSTAPSSFGLDSAVARDFRTQQPCIPGSLLKGKLHEALIQLGSSAKLETLFGKDTERDSGNAPERGTLIFGDFLTQTAETKSSSVSRIAIDHDTGSVQHAMLRVIETPFPPGQPVEFTGCVSTYCDAPAAQALQKQLTLGLQWLTQVGSQRTTGFGRLLSVTVAAPKVAESDPEKFTAPVALSLTLRPHGPLCISKPKIGDNLFESEDIIPGNMLAGAVAQTAKAMDVTIPYFDAIRFRHAFPTTAAERPRALPLSTVKAGSIPYDIAFQREPVLLKNDAGKFSAPAFPLDWKQHDDVLSKLHWASPARELRVRTAIDSTTRTADKGGGTEGKLFAWEMVHPFTSDHTEVTWRTQIDLSKVKDPTATANALAQVLGQLGFLSKTKALCTVEISALDQAPAPPALKEGQPLALVLQTPVLLADPRFQKIQDVPTSGALSAQEMLQLYTAIWTELSGESLALSHHFAQQTLVGGNHLAKRYQKDQAYDPWLLTAAGSVFVFTVRNAALAADKLKDWSTTGLPLPAWAVTRYGDKWDSHPYIPQNGFGEISLHQPVVATPIVRPVTLAQTILS
jgi:hypothetical protein